MSSSVTGFPESLDGRVKTLHPSVHAGLLADLRLEDHERQLAELGIAPFELVVVNLYPFVETVASGAQGDDVVEQIDIGGPAMVRASAKNHANVAIVVSPESYPAVIDAIARRRHDPRPAPRARGARVRAHRRVRHAPSPPGSPTAPSAEDGPARAPHDQAPSGSRPCATARTRTSARRSTRAPAATASPRPRSCRARRCRTTTTSTRMPRCAPRSTWSSPPSRSSSTPTRAASRSPRPNALDPIASAHLRAHECDPVSAFGGVIAANRTVTLKMAENLRDIFTEVIVAPDFEPAALEVFALKKNLRVLQLPADWQQERMDVRLRLGRPAAAGRRPLPRRHRVGRQGLAARVGRAARARRR